MLKPCMIQDSLAYISRNGVFVRFNPVVYSVQLLIYGFIVTLAISSVLFLHVKMYTRYKSM